MSLWSPCQRNRISRIRRRLSCQQESLPLAQLGDGPSLQKSLCWGGGPSPLAHRKQGRQGWSSQTPQGWWLPCCPIPPAASLIPPHGPERQLTAHPTVPLLWGLGAGLHPTAGTCPSGLAPRAWVPPPPSPLPAPGSPGLDPVWPHPLSPARGQHATADTSCCTETETVWAGPPRDTQGTHIKYSQSRVPPEPRLFVWKTRMTRSTVRTTNPRTRRARLSRHPFR